MTFKRLAWLILPLLFGLLGFVISPAARASSDQAPVLQGQSLQPEMQAGNYCISCHTNGDERLNDATRWDGGIARQSFNPCPGLQVVQEELYYTERMLLAIQRAQVALPNSPAAEKAVQRANSAAEGYARMLDAPLTSLEAFTSQAQMVRYNLGKSYNLINQAREAAKARNALVVGCIVTLFLLAALIWGGLNARKFTAGVKWSPVRALGWPKLAALSFILLLFALPIFRVFSTPTATATEDELAQLAVLDTASRSAQAAERAEARAWMLAKIGAAWLPLDPSRGAGILEDARLASEENRQSSAALWGQALAAQEQTVGNPVNFEKAGLAINEIRAVQGRAWDLRLAATELIKTNRDQAAEFLHLAVQKASQAQGVYRDLDLRSVAVAWTELDAQKAVAVAVDVVDPALRSWALREIAAASRQPGIFELAAQAARLIDDPGRRVQALAEIGRESGHAAYFEEALQAVGDLNGETRAFALGYLSAASKNRALAMHIDPAYPQARALAYLRLGDYIQAWDAAGKIADPFEKARAQSDIAAAWENEAAAQEIEFPLLRDRALTSVAVKTGDKPLVSSLATNYYRVIALTGLGEFSTAQQVAGELADAYPVLGLGLAWSATDAQSALALMDLMDREADKAVLLREIAVRKGDRQLFERALNMALAARVRGDALAPAQASLSLALASHDPEWARLAFEQAYSTALAISRK